MYQGSNKTALASQTQIADALLGLMNESPYAQISICQICREADVSRQTFYSLFESKEQVIVYELGKKYCIDLQGDCCSDTASLSLDHIAQIYSRYITANGAFLKLLAENDILDCMTDSLYSSFEQCSRFFPELENTERTYASAFLAGGLTSIAQSYVKNGETADADRLAGIIRTLFSGSLFT